MRDLPPLAMEHAPPVPADIIAIAVDWHGGQASSLYAIASTGGLTLNTDRTRHMSEADRLELQSDRWARLANELDDVVKAGDIDPFMADYCRAMAERMEDAADVLRMGDAG